MTDTQQPGVEIDAAKWQAFREEVKRRRGGVRGHLKTELENAIDAYILGGDTTPGEIDQRLQRIEAAVGAAEADGGTHTVEPSSHTHAPPDQKPAANAATEKKVAYLAESARDEVGTSGVPRQIPRDTLRQVVKDEYGFRSDTAKRYVGELVSYFDLQQHPEHDHILVSDEWIADYVNEELKQ